MDWKTLLSEHRIGQETQYKSAANSHRPPWQFDFDRITFSSAFRRMQDKTQVFPLSSSDYIRTRLTHSMEVAAVARSLGGLVAEKIQKQIGSVNPLEIGMILAAATLAHDIGNPPFGHSGEDAIQTWFKESKAVAEFKEELSPEQKADFENYEGNAQGFRILTRLQMYKARGGMRLTAATLGAFSKYPVQAPVKGRNHRGKSTAKFGFFQSEKKIFEELAERTGLEPRAGEANCWCRHPLAFLVEAADDICYRSVDLEDAFRQNLISYEETEAVVAPALSGEDMKRVMQETDDDSRVDVIRSLLIRNAMDKVATFFFSAHDAILDGKFDQDLVSQTEIEPVFNSIKKLLIERVYNNDRVLRVEMTGYEVIGGLLERFVQATSDAYHTQNAGRKMPPKSKKLFELLPDQFIGPQRKVAADAYARLQGVVDYVTGMTDSYALNLYRNISGISLP